MMGEEGEDYEEEYEPEMEEEMMGEGHQQTPRAEAPIRTPINSAHADLPNRPAEAEAPPRAVSQAEIPSRHEPDRSARGERPPRVVPHVRTAASRSERQKVTLGLGSKGGGQVPSNWIPPYRTSKAPQQGRPPSKAEAQMRPQTTPVVNGRAPAPSSNVTASGHGFVTDKDSTEYDVGITPGEDTTFTAGFDMQWDATGRDLASDPQLRKFTLSEEDLRDIFAMVVKNPDRALTDPSAYDQKDVDLSQVLLKKFTIRGVSQNTGAVLDILADPMKLKFLNGLVKPRQNRRCMLAIGPRTKQSILGGANGIVIIDNSGFINTKTFKTFGHINIEKFKKDIIYPPDSAADQRLEVLKESQLARLITGNVKHLRERFPRHAEITSPGEHGLKCQMEVVVEALNRFNIIVSPLMRGIINATRPVDFELLPGKEGNWDGAIASGGSLNMYATATITVHVVAEVEYCFPESAFKRYKGQAAQTHNTRAQFNEMLKEHQLS